MAIRKKKFECVKPNKSEMLAVNLMKSKIYFNLTEQTVWIEGEIYIYK